MRQMQRGSYLQTLFIGANMTRYGGRNVVAVSSLFRTAAKIDVVHVGGDTLGVTMEYALKMQGLSVSERKQLLTEMKTLDGNLLNRSAYLLPKALFHKAGLSIVNAVGGNPSATDLRVLTSADYASTRNPVAGIALVPDSGVMLRKLLDHKVEEQRNSSAQQLVGQVMGGRPYWAVQFNRGLDGVAIDSIAQQLCASPSAEARELALCCSARVARRTMTSSRD